jgi:hypothetical protein
MGERRAQAAQIPRPIEPKPRLEDQAHFKDRKVHPACLSDAFEAIPDIDRGILGGQEEDGPRGSDLKASQTGLSRSDRDGQLQR